MALESEKIFFVFPGQGSQYNQMCKKLYEKYDFVKKLFKKSSEILEYDIKKITVLESNKKIDNTKFTQPAIFIYSYIANYLLNNNNIFPNAVAGHSLGEFSALTSCGSLSFENALKIIKVRSEAMSISGESKPGRMAAVINSDINDIKKLIKKIDGVICIANINSKKQIIISGEKKSIEKFNELSKSYNIKKTIILNVSGAFHSPLMKNAKNILKNVINSVEFNDANIPIYQNFMPTKTILAKDIKHNLINQIDNPVLWQDTMIKIKENNYNHIFEVGPKKVLTNLFKTVSNDLQVTAFEDSIYYD